MASCCGVNNPDRTRRAQTSGPQSGPLSRSATPPSSLPRGADGRLVPQTTFAADTFGDRAPPATAWGSAPAPPSTYGTAAAPSFLQNGGVNGSARRSMWMANTNGRSTMLLSFSPTGQASRRFTRSVTQAFKFDAISGILRPEWWGRTRSAEGCAPAAPRAPGASCWDVRYDCSGMIDFFCTYLWVMITVTVSLIASLAAAVLDAGPIPTFWLAFVALIPLSIALGDLTEMLAAWCGDRSGGLINATLGNATEAIVIVSALSHGLVSVTQAALMGSIIGNLLFVLGAAIVAGGVAQRGAVQLFDERAARADVGVLFVAAIAVIVPSMFGSLSEQNGYQAPAKNILEDSHITASILLLAYVLYLAFSLTQPSYREKWDAAKEEVHSRRREVRKSIYEGQTPFSDDADMEEDMLLLGPPPADEGAAPLPPLSAPAIVLLMVVCIVLVALLSNTVVLNIFPMSTALGFNAGFVSVAILPFVGNVAELASACVAAAHGNLNLSIAITLGSATQVALLLIPLSVLFGWSVGVPMSLFFNPTLAAALFASVVSVALLLTDGEGHWLKGVLLLVAYSIIVCGVVLVWPQLVLPSASGGVSSTDVDATPTANGGSNS